MNRNTPQINFTIRQASELDAKAIHEAHMKSIKEVCSIDHTAEEINAWGNRPYREDIRIEAISNQFVYVVEIENTVEGFLHFNILENKTDAYVFGLYLTKNANGHGAGNELIKKLFEICKIRSILKINLHSTITAHKFYLKMGFADTAAMTTVLINQTPIRCIPMAKNIRL